jgi:hypothetical protein
MSKLKTQKLQPRPSLSQLRPLPSLGVKLPISKPGEARKAQQEDGHENVKEWRFGEENQRTSTRTKKKPPVLRREICTVGVSSKHSHMIECKKDEENLSITEKNARMENIGGEGVGSRIVLGARKIVKKLGEWRDLIE